MRVSRSPDVEVAAIASKGQMVVLRIKDKGAIDQLEGICDALRLATKESGVHFLLIDESFVEVARIDDGAR